MIRPVRISRDTDMNLYDKGCLEEFEKYLTKKVMKAARISNFGYHPNIAEELSIILDHLHRLKRDWNLEPPKQKAKAEMTKIHDVDL